MAKSLRSLNGQVVAITGGARGIGRATATALIAQGARVAIGDIDVAAGREDRVASSAPGRIGLPLDVTDRDSFAGFLDEVERQLGPLDVLVNNAGIMPIGPFVEGDRRCARRLVDINIHGVILGSKLAVERFMPRGRGHIVQLASIAGKGGFPGGATYCATKHAVVGLTEALRAELRGTGDRAAPGAADRRQHRAVLGRRRRRAASPRLEPAGRRQRDRRAAPDRQVRALRAEVGRRRSLACRRCMPRRCRGDHPLHQGRPACCWPPTRPRGAPTRARINGSAPAAAPEQERRRRVASAGEPGRQPVGDQAPDLGPASSCRKWQAPAITWSTSPPSAAAKRRPVSSGSTGSESAHRISLRPGVAAQRVEHALAGAARPGASGVSGRISGNARAPALAAGVRERRVVGGDHLVAGVVQAGPPHEQPDREILGSLDEGAERHPGVVHRLVAGEQAGVEDHDAGDPVGCSTATRRPIGPPQSWTTTVASRRSSSSTRAAIARRVAVVGVPADVDRLVRAAEPGQVGRDAAVARVAHRRDHLAPQERPRGLAVHEQDRRSLADVEVGQAQSPRTPDSATRTGSRGGRSASSSGVRIASVIA